MFTYLRPKEYYEDLYDRLTVEFARRNLKHFMSFYDKWFEIMPDEKPSSLRSSFHLNHIYMQFVGFDLLERYDSRDSRIQEMIARDTGKDEKLSNARLKHEPVCQHCSKTGLRITDKSLMSRQSSNVTSNEEHVLFMLRCSYCMKNSAYWEDGSSWEHRNSYCPKCKSVMTEATNKKAKSIITTYTCVDCGYSYKDKLNLSTRKPAIDPDFEKDRAIFCFHDKMSLDEHRDAKYRYEGLRQMFEEHKEKEKNKALYDQIAKIKKLKLIEIKDNIEAALKDNGFVELTLDKPEQTTTFKVGFSCLDSNVSREDYESRKHLKKALVNCLMNTNWRLVPNSLGYRLGYLSGQIQAYETEKQLIKLIQSKSKAP